MKRQILCPIILACVLAGCASAESGQMVQAPVSYWALNETEPETFSDFGPSTNAGSTGIQVDDEFLAVMQALEAAEASLADAEKKINTDTAAADLKDLTASEEKMLAAVPAYSEKNDILLSNGFDDQNAIQKHINESISEKSPVQVESETNTAESALSEDDLLALIAGAQLNAHNEEITQETHELKNNPQTEPSTGTLPSGSQANGDSFVHEQQPVPAQKTQESSETVLAANGQPSRSNIATAQAEPEPSQEVSATHVIVPPVSKKIQPAMTVEEPATVAQPEPHPEIAKAEPAPAVIATAPVSKTPAVKVEQAANPMETAEIVAHTEPHVETVKAEPAPTPEITVAPVVAKTASSKTPVKQDINVQSSGSEPTLAKKMPKTESSVASSGSVSQPVAPKVTHAGTVSVSFPSEQQNSLAYVLAVYAVNDVDLYQVSPRGDYPSISELYQYAFTHQLVYQSTHPTVGDVVFFHNTYDRNRDELWNDWHTLIGIVETVDDDDNITILVYSDNKIQRYQMNLKYPEKKKSKKGMILNSQLRPDAAGQIGTTSKLFAGFANLLGNKTKMVVIDNWQPGMKVR